MPDAGMAYFQMTRQRRIIQACEALWGATGPNGLANKSDCSGFVQSVAEELGVDLTGTANAMYDTIKKSPWSLIGIGDAAAYHAAVAATNGKFVVGAWRNAAGGHGHVAVIVDTNNSAKEAAHRSRALAYWGTLNSVGKKRERHTYCWGADKRPNVIYSCISIDEA